jgi:hypothetical protein
MITNKNQDFETLFESDYSHLENSSNLENLNEISLGIKKTVEKTPSKFGTKMKYAAGGALVGGYLVNKFRNKYDFVPRNQPDNSSKKGKKLKKRKEIHEEYDD